MFIFDLIALILGQLAELIFSAPRNRDNAETVRSDEERAAAKRNKYSRRRETVATIRAESRASLHTRRAYEARRAAFSRI